MFPFVYYFPHSQEPLQLIALERYKKKRSRDPNYVELIAYTYKIERKNIYREENKNMLKIHHFRSARKCICYIIRTKNEKKNNWENMKIQRKRELWNFFFLYFDLLCGIISCSLINARSAKTDPHSVGQVH